MSDIFVDEGSSVNPEDFSIDFSDVKGLDPLPRGWYPVEIVKVTPGYSKAGNAKLDLQMTVLEGHEDAGRYIFDTLTFTPKAMWRVKDFLLAAGFKQKFSGSVNPDDLVGQQLDVLLSIETSTQVNPETEEPYPPRNRVNKVRALE